MNRKRRSSLWEYTDKEIYVRISANIKILRIKSGYSQQLLADILGVTRSSYTYYELGKVSLNISKLILIARLYDCALEDLYKKDMRQEISGI